MSEWVSMLISLLLGFISGQLFCHNAYEFQKKITKRTILEKYHVHHSAGGTVITLIGLFLAEDLPQLFLISFGIGMIIHSVYLEKQLIFITKN